MLSARRPTPEQEAAVAAFRRGDDLVLQAGAGTGKTTTLTMLGKAVRWQGRYLAFNKSIAAEAERKFGGNVRCSTAHKLAFKAVGHRFVERLNRPRMTTVKLAQLLGITMEVTIGVRKLRPVSLCSIARETVLQYCYSADEFLARRHVRWQKGITSEHEHDQLAELVLPIAEKMWADLQTPDRGKVPFKQDHYLKMWALTRPRIYGEFLLLDEAQDTNPVVEQVFLAQGQHAQLVMVGDSAQAIYGWRGARDVMTGFDGRQLALSHSFRFGPAIAAEANRWLAIADAPIRLTGSPHVSSCLQPLPGTPDAILCRTNGGAIAEILTLLADGRRVALAGRAAELQSLAEAAQKLQAGQRTDHRDLVLFSTWGEVQEYVEWDPDGRDLLPFVDVIDEHGVDVVLQTLSQLSVETEAEVTVSTAHSAKGREWSSVRIAGDFPEPVDPEEVDLAGNPLPGEIEPEEARLAYVAVTRAQHQLDLGGLSWINQHPDGNPSPGPVVAFSAIHPDAGRIDATVADLGCGLTWDQVHKVRPRVALRCPECGHGVHARVSPRGLRHFAHDPGRPDDCAWLNESLEHHQLKLALAVTVRTAGWHAALEVTGPDRTWRADVLATSPDGTRRIAWEAQLSPITDDDIRDRTVRYWADDVEVCWVSPATWAPWMGLVPSIRVAALEDSQALACVDGVAQFRFQEGSWRVPPDLPLIEFVRGVQDETMVFHEVLPRYRRIRIGAGGYTRRRAIWTNRSSIDTETQHEAMRQRQEAWKQRQEEQAEARRKEEERQRLEQLEAERLRKEKEREELQQRWRREREIWMEQERLRREAEERHREEQARAAEEERQRQERIEKQASTRWAGELSETRAVELRAAVVEHLWKQELTKAAAFDSAGATVEHAYGTAIYLRGRLYGVLRPSPGSLHRLPRNVTVFVLNAREARLLTETGKVTSDQVTFFDFPDEEQLFLL